MNLGPTQMMRGKCGTCAWEFDIVALSMQITAAAAVIQAAHCPMCGAGPDKVTAAEPRRLTPEEAAHKERLQAGGAP